MRKPRTGRMSQEPRSGMSRFPGRHGGLQAIHHPEVLTTSGFREALGQRWGGVKREERRGRGARWKEREPRTEEERQRLLERRPKPGRASRKRSKTKVGADKSKGEEGDDSRTFIVTFQEGHGCQRYRPY
ncbi:hypothetical protein NDU88_001103 [Pleurodeles waltl]|uniref:Uncharacterized protein n=1 Tax=Pleurodeles waltl TaxID=8319 RepID=A0AAV7LBM3_PLEWA|nr:hypothetical protein NDU88_001103 [Pleurodeles waltl]